MLKPDKKLAAMLILLSATVPSLAVRSRRGPTAPHASPTNKKKSAKPVAKGKWSPGQRAIDDSRAAEIQQALVKAGYLKDSSGHWDAPTESAMQKLQEDNGWQTKLVPDSRALIKLGLGPEQPLAPELASETLGTK